MLSSPAVREKGLHRGPVASPVILVLAGLAGRLRRGPGRGDETPDQTSEQRPDRLVGRAGARLGHALVVAGVLALAGVGGALEAQEPGEEAPLPVLSTVAGTLGRAGQETPLPLAVTEAGPVFAIEAVVANLGGTLTPDALGQGYTLAVEGTPVVFGASSAAMTVGEEIVLLSQPARQGDVGPLVPLDFLQRTYGDLLGYLFTWEAPAARLVADREASRELPVTVDVVHLQGITTVVLQFPSAPRLRVAEQPGRLEVLLTGDRTVPSGARVINDPLVSGIEVASERIVIRTAEGTEADHYTLRRPFRLVFEVFRAEAPSAAPVNLRPPMPEPGLQTIVIDPGHGGGETGAIGPGGTAEKDLTLILAQTLESALERRLGVRVVLTRNEDADLPLDTRAAIANQNKADLFVSIHLNSSLGASAQGTETYFLAPQASDAAAASSAAVENQAAEAMVGTDGVGGDPLYDLQLMLWDLAQSHHLAESQRLANLIQRELDSALGLRDRGVKQAPFRVLMGAAMPAVLVELGFLSNPDEEAKLNTPTHRAALVDALVRAIERFRAELGAGATPAPPSQPGPELP
jgi:N-acetylmuramoyl-L-alanine amidase